MVGSVLTQVCIGEFEVILRWDSDLEITVESAYRVRTKSGVAQHFDEVRRGASCLVELLGLSIVSARIADASALILSLDSESELILFGDNEEYECYTISHADRTYVV